MTTLKDILNYLENQTKSASWNDDALDEVDWETEHGILLSVNDARMLLDRINELSNLPNRMDLS